jgi:hypothetical protein
MLIEAPGLGRLNIFRFVPERPELDPELLEADFSESFIIAIVKPLLKAAGNYSLEGICSCDLPSET